MVFCGRLTRGVWGEDSDFLVEWCEQASHSYFHSIHCWQLYCMALSCQFWSVVGTVSMLLIQLRTRLVRPWWKSASRDMSLCPLTVSYILEHTVLLDPYPSQGSQASTEQSVQGCGHQNELWKPALGQQSQWRELGVLWRELQQEYWGWRYALELPFLILSSFVPLRYLSMYLAYLICSCVVLLLNCDNLIATNVISGLVPIAA